MIVIGLTGGISSGKSMVSHHLNEKYGVPVIDADLIAYELSEPHQPVWEGYVNHFGKETALFPDGKLNRNAIAQIVFSNKDEEAWMNSMALPLIKAEVLQRIDAFKKEGHKAVILDAPLLIECGWESMADTVWVVYVTPQVQLERLMKRNNYDEQTARMRIASQLSLETKKKKADTVIDNSGTMEDSLRQIDTAWEKLIA